MRFGIHLVEQSVVSPEQFTDAVARQMRDRVCLGQLAMDSRILTKIQVLHILSVQTKTRQRFGQIALDLGYLSKQELADLLLEQDERLRPLSQILVSMGALTPGDVDRELQKYRRQLADRMDSSGVLSSVV